MELRLTIVSRMQTAFSMNDEVPKLSQSPPAEDRGRREGDGMALSTGGPTALPASGSLPLPVARRWKGMAPIPVVERLCFLLVALIKSPLLLFSMMETIDMFNHQLFGFQAE